MNVYDFDNTIYNGDSTLDFYFFCLKKHPKILKVFPIQLYSAISYKLKKYTKTEFKEKFYTFLSLLKDVDLLLDDFWKKNEYKIKDFYLKQKCADDVIISASPHFLLIPICDKLEIKNLIASEVDKNSGKYIGINCYGTEKVNRFKKIFSLSEIDNFYSDSLSDTPIAQYAQHPFLVSGNSITIWNTDFKKNKKAE